MCFHSSHKRKFRHCNIGSHEDTRQASPKIMKALDIQCSRFPNMVENNLLYSVWVVSFFVIKNSKSFNTSDRHNSGPYRRKLHLQWNTLLPSVMRRSPSKPLNHYVIFLIPLLISYSTVLPEINSEIARETSTDIPTVLSCSSAQNTVHSLAFGNEERWIINLYEQPS